MTPPLYSIRIANFAYGVVPATTVATVPSGFVYVMKGIDLTSFQGSGGAAMTVITAGNTWYAASFTAPWQHVGWTGTQVANPGETIQVTVTSGAVAGMISGFKLTIPPP